VLGGATVKQLIELSGRQLSIRAIARRLDISRNTVRKYLRSPGLPVAKPRPRRPSKVDPFRDHVRRRLAAGVENCVVLLRELRARGYAGSYSILKDHVRPLRLGRAVKATMRFETKPGEQAQVDFGHFPFLTPDGQRHWYWGFVMVLAWSRLLYVEFIRRADVASFIRCHLNAFEHFGGLPRTCLYDNTKVVVLGRDAGGVPHWNATFLDFALRLPSIRAALAALERERVRIAARLAEEASRPTTDRDALVAQLLVAQLIGSLSNAREVLDTGEPEERKEVVRSFLAGIRIEHAAGRAVLRWYRPPQIAWVKLVAVGGIEPPTRGL
jgi:transposase